MKKSDTGLLPFLLLASLASCSQAELEKKPNVVFIYADDLGFGDLGCYGARNVQTPNVDSLAASGTLFTNAHSVASTSTPSRYSLLTAEYPWRKPGTDVAAGDAAMIISPEQYTVADLFKDAGYTTAAFGKWHLGLGAEGGRQNWNEPLSPALSDIGFDYSYIMAATADRVPCVFIENGKVANYDASSPIYVSYDKNFDGEPTGRDNPELLYNLKHSHGHDMSIVNGIGRIGYMKGGGAALWKDENIADSITAHAVRFIAENKERPFFMYFATNDVHVPRFPHERFRGATNMGLRGDAIAQFDWSVGEIVGALRRCGLLDNTIIILSSDNGPVVDDGYADSARELLNGHDPMGGLRGGKYSCYEAGTRVPFIVYWSRASKKPSVSNALVSQIDFMTVAADIANVEIPDHAAPDALEGAAKYWLGNEQTGRDYAVGMASNHTLWLNNGTWKYIEPSDGPAMVPWGPKIETGYNVEPQLYRTADVNSAEGVAGDYEQENLALSHGDVLHRMDSLLNDVRNHPQRIKRP